MIRTLISLDEDDKRWLDEQARTRQVPMTEIVREAVKEFRHREERAARTSLQVALARTAGICSGEDGLALQERLRREWE